MSTTITIRVDKETKARLSKLAKATDRSISYLLGNAIDKVLDAEEWQIGEIRKRVELADRPGAKFVSHDEIESWLKTWGAKKERKAP